MNNLVLALIAIGFASVLMFAGVSYMSSSSTASINLSAKNIADVEHLIGDYQNLKINLGRSPTGADFQAAFAGGGTSGASQNGKYKFKTDSANNVLATKIVSIPGVVPAGPFTDAGWTYVPANQPYVPMDLFCMKISNSGPSAKAVYLAAKMAAQKEMLAPHISVISLGLNGCARTSNTDPSTWPTTVPTTYYLTTKMSIEAFI